MKKLERQPNLSTIIMIEKEIRAHSGELSLTELWRSLPKSCMYQTYKKTIDYLIDSCKIVIDRDGKAEWIFDPEIYAKSENYHKV